MVATISGEAAQMEESISTCRFAQRVALVTNEVRAWGAYESLQVDIKWRCCMSTSCQQTPCAAATVHDEQRNTKPPSELHNIVQFTRTQHPTLLLGAGDTLAPTSWLVHEIMPADTWLCNRLGCYPHPRHSRQDC